MADDGKSWGRRWWRGGWPTREMTPCVTKPTGGIFEAFGDKVDMTVERVGDLVDLVLTVLT